MNIEIHQPELEALIEQRMATGRFRDVEDVLYQALRSAEAEPEPATSPPPKSLSEVFAVAREILAGEELDIRRDQSPARSVDLS